MKLYRSKVPAIATECIHRLIQDGDIDVSADRLSDAEQDLVAIMEDYLRRDMAMRDRIKDHMASRSLSYDQFGKTRNALAEESGHPLGEDLDKFFARQFTENLMISPNIDEVFADDKVIYKKLLGVLKGHDVDEEAIREEAKGKVKNAKEGTVEYEIALELAIRDVKKRKGLFGPEK
jgi:hypothetical protein